MLRVYLTKLSLQKLFMLTKIFTNLRFVFLVDFKLDALRNEVFFLVHLFSVIVFVRFGEVSISSINDFDLFSIEVGFRVDSE